MFNSSSKNKKQARAQAAKPVAVFGENQKNPAQPGSSENQRDGADSVNQESRRDLESTSSPRTDSSSETEPQVPNTEELQAIDLQNPGDNAILQQTKQLAQQIHNNPDDPTILEPVTNLVNTISNSLPNEPTTTAPNPEKLTPEEKSRLKKIGDALLNLVNSIKAVCDNPKMKAVGGVLLKVLKVLIWPLTKIHNLTDKYIVSEDLLKENKYYSRTIFVAAISLCMIGITALAAGIAAGIAGVGAGVGVVVAAIFSPYAVIGGIKLVAMLSDTLLALGKISLSGLKSLGVMLAQCKDWIVYHSKDLKLNIDAYLDQRTHKNATASLHSLEAQRNHLESLDHNKLLQTKKSLENQLNSTDINDNAKKDLESALDKTNASIEASTTLKMVESLNTRIKDLTTKMDKITDTSVKLQDRKSEIKSEYTNKTATHKDRQQEIGTEINSTLKKLGEDLRSDMTKTASNTVKDAITAPYRTAKSVATATKDTAIQGANATKAAVSSLAERVTKNRENNKGFLKV